jgi:dephospho-CoA kinase
MKIIGLTGSIGMGKSTLAAQARALGIPVHDADACVHRLMQPDGVAFDAVQNVFPNAITNGEIDRKKLGKIVFDDSKKRKILESILHPLVRKESGKFIKLARKARHKICILDIPLLFETGRDQDMDEVITVSAPSWVQRRRVLSRDGMTVDKFESILQTQIPDNKKRVRSDHVILSCRGKRHSLNGLKKIKNKHA